MAPHPSQSETTFKASQQVRSYVCKTGLRSTAGRSWFHGGGRTPDGGKGQLRGRERYMLQETLNLVTATAAYIEPAVRGTSTGTFGHST
ncbi:hypothetical protein NPIL_361811 [Nephila pilipes]|uniref:Uncharacterized protein n=1 Tax=Nephila pilipes TaxID=299642 RepID=A0A8X6UF21_NEPPI|nr:hypothetical protein NPIL_361811 [Nephila pilipes]